MKNISFRIRLSMMMVLSFVLCLSFVAGTFVTGSVAKEFTDDAGTKTKARPNVIVFLVDDLGWQDTSVSFHTKKTPLNRRYRTPNMERLASQGMKFTNAYACCVCSPSRVSLITGINAARHRVTDWTLTYNGKRGMVHPTLKIPDWNYGGTCMEQGWHNTVQSRPLPSILKEAGYRTIHVGKAHFGAIGTPGADPKHLGFEVNIAGHAAGAPASYYGEHNFAQQTKLSASKKKLGLKPGWRDVPGLEKYHGKNIQLTEVLTREAIREVDKALAEDKPFFLYMAHYAVHTPIMADDRFVGHYPDLDPIEAAYASMIEGMDRSLGDLMNHLVEKGIDKNTAVLFMSDNGGLSAGARGGKKHTHNRPLSSGKGSAREGGIREPMLAYWPGVTKPGSTCDTPVIIEDFFPSVLEIAGVDLPKQMPQTVDGVSFCPLLKEENRASDSRVLFWHYPNWWGRRGPGIASSSTIRRGDWKLIYYHDGPYYELFNLAKDIGETTNLADVAVEKRNELAAELGAYLKKVNAQMTRDPKTGQPVPLPGPR